MTVQSGDIILTGVKSQGAVSVAIKLGAKLRYGPRSPHTAFSHAAIVYDVLDGVPVLVEAVKSGVVKRRMHYLPGDYVIVKPSTLATLSDIGQMRRFLDNTLAARERYGFAQFAGQAIYCLTGTAWLIAKAGTSICSGLCCDAGTRWGAMPSGAWKRPPLAMMPADIHAQATAERVPVVAG